MNCERFVLRYDEQERSCHRAGRTGGREGYYTPLKSRKGDYGHSSTGGGGGGRRALLPLCLF